MINYLVSGAVVVHSFTHAHFLITTWLTEYGQHAQSRQKGEWTKWSNATISTMRAQVRFQTNAHAAKIDFSRFVCFSLCTNEGIIGGVTNLSESVNNLNHLDGQWFEWKLKTVCYILHFVSERMAARSIIVKLMRVLIICLSTFGFASISL